MQFVYFSSLFSSSPIAIRQSLWIGLSYSPFAVLIRTFRTWLSSPGYVSTINAIFHWDLLCFLSSSRTRSPTLISSLVRNHLFLGKRLGAKYLIKQFQNWSHLFYLQCFLAYLWDWSFLQTLVVEVKCVIQSGYHWVWLVGFPKR